MPPSMNQSFQPPPVLRDLFPRTAGTVHLTPPQTVAFVEMLVRQMNASTKLPLQAKLVKHTDTHLSIDISVLLPALAASDER